MCVCLSLICVLPPPHLPRPQLLWSTKSAWSRTRISVSSWMASTLPRRDPSPTPRTEKTCTRVHNLCSPRPCRNPSSHVTPNCPSSSTRSCILGLPVSFLGSQDLCTCCVRWSQVPGAVKSYPLTFCDESHKSFPPSLPHPLSTVFSHPRKFVQFCQGLATLQELLCTRYAPPAPFRRKKSDPIGRKKKVGLK